ncbi:MAG TPA: hypothetical protein VL945_01100 [Candidatus Saccharimonadales bacterium]|nr:hypothetical protein [Candidatus Saccharimonadales bacterium]
MSVEELDFQESLEFAGEHGTKLVWLGREPVDYIRELLDLDPSKMIDADPNMLVYADRDVAEKFKDHVFVCYHGNTSRYVANALKDKFGVESLNMKGGVTAVVGEIF